MTRWRTDFRVKSDMVLAKDQKKIVFKASDGSHEIHLRTKRGEGKHAADALYLVAHVILDDDDPQHAADEARTLLDRFLDVLAIVTSAYYRIEDRILVADWSPGLTERRFLLFKKFPDPNVPIYGLCQQDLDSVAKLMRNPIPRTVQLAIRWWADGVSHRPAREQFQYFWYALEILAEHAKPAMKVASKCSVCAGDLYCPACGKTPLHRPFPKQAIQMLIQKHVTGQPEELFKVADEVRNWLLHGEDPKEIERDLKMKWEKLSDALGRATWGAILSTLLNIAAANVTEPEKLALAKASTYVHYEFFVTSVMSMGAAHADPANPQVEEFEPDMKVSLVVKEREEVEERQQDSGDGQDAAGEAGSESAKSDSAPDLG